MIGIMLGVVVVVGSVIGFAILHFFVAAHGIDWRWAAWQVTAQAVTACAPIGGLSVAAYRGSYTLALALVWLGASMGWLLVLTGLPAAVMAIREQRGLRARAAKAPTTPVPGVRPRLVSNRTQEVDLAMRGLSQSMSRDFDPDEIAQLAESLHQRGPRRRTDAR